MAKNFSITKKADEKAKILRIFLEGDFDGNSAWELINLLTEVNDFEKIIVNTEKLTNIYRFGMNTLVNGAVNMSNKNLVIFEGPEEKKLSLKK